MAVTAHYINTFYMLGSFMSLLLIQVKDFVPLYLTVYLNGTLIQNCQLSP